MRQRPNEVASYEVLIDELPGLGTVWVGGGSSLCLRQRPNEVALYEVLMDELPGLGTVSVGGGLLPMAVYQSACL